MKKQDDESPAYNEYRRKWEENPKNFIAGEFPIHLDIEPASGCNLKCPMCFQSFNPPPKGFIDLALYKRIIDEGAAHGLCSIKLTYRGEPLLHPGLPEMIKYAKDKGILDVMFNTNGMLLTEKKARQLIEAGLDKIIFSIDGYTKETYEKIRRGAKFETAVKNIKRLQELKKEMNSSKPIVRVQMIDSPETHSQVEGYLKFWGAIADHVAMEDLLDWNIKQEQCTVDNDFACAQLWQRLLIMYDGEYILCCGDHYNRMKLGNYNDKPVAEMWNSPLLKGFRELHKKGESHRMLCCRYCGMRKHEIEKKLK